MTADTLAKLAACPFCGSENARLDEGKNADGSPWPCVQCDDCEAVTGADVWNRRALTAQALPAAEPLKWASTTPAYIKYITDSKYNVLSPEAQQWYRPICQTCAQHVAQVPAGWVLVTQDFVRGFSTLAHNYSLKAEAPFYYRGTEADAFSAAYRRCGDDLAKLRAMLAAALPQPPQPQEDA